MRTFYILEASLKAKQALDFQEQESIRLRMSDEQRILGSCVLEKKNLATIKAVSRVRKAQRYVNKARKAAGEAFVKDHDDTHDSDEDEGDYNDAVETSSVADRFEREFGHISDEDVNEPEDVDSMVHDALGNVAMDVENMGIEEVGNDNE